MNVVDTIRRVVKTAVSLCIQPTFYGNIGIQTSVRVGYAESVDIAFDDEAYAEKFEKKKQLYIVSNNTDFLFVSLNYFYLICCNNRIVYREFYEYN